MRRALTWLLLVPLALLGSEAAHTVDYWLVEQDPGQRAALLAQTGHGYLDLLPAAIATWLGGRAALRCSAGRWREDADVARRCCHSRRLRCCRRSPSPGVS